MGQDAHMIEDMTPREMYKMLKDARADIMLSGGRSQFIALKASMPWLDINQERHHAYMGYVGMVKLVEEIDKALYNPIWAAGPQARALGEIRRTIGKPSAIAQVEAEAAALAADPVKAEEARRAKKICNCKSVDLGAIEDAIIAHMPHDGRGRAEKRPTPRAAAAPAPGASRKFWPACRHCGYGRHSRSAAAE